MYKNKVAAYTLPGSKNTGSNDIQREGFVYKNPARTGKWIKIQGRKNDDVAAVYQLDPDKPAQSISFFKADDNILFFLDKDMKVMVGDEHFSYTLNRTGE